MKKFCFFVLALVIQFLSPAQSNALVPGDAETSGFSKERQRIAKVVEEFVQKNRIKGATAFIALVH